MCGPEASDDAVDNGAVAVFNGEKRIFYYGYWIRYYEPPAETLTAKKNLIAGLTRRTFHHTESGINTPGENLDLARECFQQADNEQEKRVSGAMLAGALFNRATDIFTTVVELEAKGVHISMENELMKECSECLEEAMELGKLVRHVSGVEGIDELWGEPLKAFSMPLKEFYATRYVKISLTMRDIDHIVSMLRDCLVEYAEFEPLWPILERFSNYAKLNCETNKRDCRWFDIWPKFVTNAENIAALVTTIREDVAARSTPHLIAGCSLIDEGKSLMTYISGARVPMPDTAQRFIEECERFNAEYKSADFNDNE